MSSNTIAVAELWIQNKDWQWGRLHETEQKWNKKLQGLDSDD